MSLTSIDQLDQSLLSSDFTDNPYPTYSQLRVGDPVHWSDAWDCWVLTRYADVRATMNDLRLSNWRLDSYVKELPAHVRDKASPLINHISKWMGFSDPPDHTRLRKLGTKAFTPQLVDSMRSRIQKIVDELIDEIEGTGHVDLIRQFAFPLPATLIAVLVGVPIEDRERFKAWSGDVVMFLGTGRSKLDCFERCQKSLVEMIDFFRSLVSQRRKERRDDLLSAMIGVGEEGDLLSEEEMLGMCTSLLIAGHETTTNLIGNGLLTLLKNPEQLRQLKQDPSSINTAIEELLRYESPLQRNWRVAKEDLKIGGKHVQKGQIVMQMLGAANRDPEQFPKPDQLDIRREPNSHVAFGYGLHFCIGARLARTEAQIAITTILSRLPSLRLVDAPTQWLRNMAFRALKTLPAEF